MLYNDILKHLIGSSFGPLQMRVLLAIIRQTYGYHRKEAEISLRLFEEMIKTNHWNISKVLKKLADNEIIFQGVGTDMGYNPVHKYSINEESFHRWNTRAGVAGTPADGVPKTPIKDKKKILKERILNLGNKMQMH
jgi:phage replication O-like protein O